jgi:hypothetical protein
MFAAFAKCLLNNLLSRICVLRFFNHNELKMSKTHFFQMAPLIYYCTVRNHLYLENEKFFVNEFLLSSPITSFFSKLISESPCIFF